MSSDKGKKASKEAVKPGKVHPFFTANNRNSNPNDPGIQEPPIIERTSGPAQQSKANSNRSSSHRPKSLTNRDRKEKDGDQVMGVTSSPIRPSSTVERTQTPFKGGAKKKKRLESTAPPAVVSPQQEEQDTQPDSTKPPPPILTAAQEQTNTPNPDSTGSKNAQTHEESPKDQEQAQESGGNEQDQANHSTTPNQDGHQTNHKEEETDGDDQSNEKQEEQGQASTSTSGQQDETQVANPTQTNSQKRGVSFGHSSSYTIDLSKKETKEWKKAYTHSSNHKVATPFLAEDLEEQSHNTKLKKIQKMMASDLGMPLDKFQEHPITELQRIQKDCFRPTDNHYNFSKKTRQHGRKMVTKTAKTPPGFLQEEFAFTDKLDKATLKDSPASRWWVASNRLMGGAWRYDRGNTPDNWEESIQALKGTATSTAPSSNTGLRPGTNLNPFVKKTCFLEVDMY